MTQRPGKTFHYKKIELLKTETLGVGSYGVVCRARCDELPCAAKVLHLVFFQFNKPGTNDLMRRFEQECHFMSQIKHPHIVQYLGVHQDKETGLPVLLMELMDESLTRFLEQSEDILPYHVEVNLCHDVSLALAYLHSNGIIHRDLSSNNVLLIAGSRAKVADFGMSKLSNVGGTRMTPMTACPGTLAYMPPEALEEPPIYKDKLDSFSFGVLAIQIMTREFPNPGAKVKTVEDRRSPVGKSQIPVLETERRRSHIELIDPTHPLLTPAVNCLKYKANERPSAQELCQHLAALKGAARYVDSGQRAKGLADKQLRIRELQRHNERQAREIENLRHQLQIREQELEDKNEQLHKKDKDLATKQEQISRLEQELKQIGTVEAGSGGLRWQVCANAPSKMHLGSTVVDGAVAYFRPGLTRRVYAYDSEVDKWSTLPVSPSGHSSLAVINGLLTAVGGEYEDEPTNTLYSLVTSGKDGSKMWVQHFPSMPTKRTFAAVLCTEMALIVAGGKSGIYAHVATIEVMDTESLEWSTVDSLPIPLYQTSITVCGDDLYFAGGITEGEKGANSVFKCSLSALLKPKQQSQSFTTWLKRALYVSASEETEWHSAACLPVYWSTYATFSGQLVAVGGRGDGNKYSAAIYAYNPTVDEWDVIGHMPTARSECLATALPHNQLMVVGGFEDKGETPVVEIAMLN